MTRRHPDHALLTNPNDTAPPRPRPGQQSPRHSATERSPDPYIPKPKNDDSVQARPLKMSRFGPPEPGPEPKPKNDDSVQARPFKNEPFGPENQTPKMTILYKPGL